jgi:homoserine O-acetyltransferase
LQTGWIDAPHGVAALGAFALDSGAVIPDFSVSYAVHGDFADKSLPLAVLLCAIGSVHHRLDFLIGPDHALDPGRYRIIAIDAIGNGLTTSPSNSVRQAGTLFPRFTIRDMVRSQKFLLQTFDVEEIDVVVGASMGGMQALQWGVQYPAAVRRIVALTPMAKTAPWAAAVNEAARQSLFGRLKAHSAGAAYPADIWDGWTPIMQLLAMRTPTQLGSQFPDAATCLAWIEQRTAWWREQRFDPIDWIYQSWAYDAHDVGATPWFDGDTARALASIRAKTLIVAPHLDLYNPVACAVDAAKHIPHCTLHQIDSPWGHLMASSADDQAVQVINDTIRDFLREE